MWESPLLQGSCCGSPVLRESLCPVCARRWEGGGGEKERKRERDRETERELSATLANHLMGCHPGLTFEGYRSISPEMKKRDERRRERDRGREIGYAASVLWSRQPLSMHLSIRSHHTASSPLWSPPPAPASPLRPRSPPPPRAIPHPLSRSLSLSPSLPLSLPILPSEKRGEGRRWKEEEEIHVGASQGGLSERTRQGGGWKEQSKGIRATERGGENLRCLIYSSFLLQTDVCRWRKTEINWQQDGRGDRGQTGRQTENRP